MSENDKATLAELLDSTQENLKKIQGLMFEYFPDAELTGGLQSMVDNVDNFRMNNESYAIQLFDVDSKTYKPAVIAPYYNEDMTTTNNVRFAGTDEPVVYYKRRQIYKEVGLIDFYLSTNYVKLVPEWSEE